RTYAVDPYKVYVIGSARLSGAQGIAIVVAAVGIVLVGLLIARTGVGRMMRALADDLPLAAIAGVRTGRVILAAWIVSGLLAGLYTLFALGVQVQFGFAGLLNFGQVAFMGIGAYTMAILVVKEDVNMWVAACCGVALAMFAGVLLGLPTLRLRADYFAITTIA